MSKNNIKKILELNNFLKEKLNINFLKKNHNNDMIYKIYHNVLINYKINFLKNLKEVDVEEFKKFINNLVNFTNDNIYNDKILTKEKLLSMHYNIMIPLTTTEKINKKYIGTYREVSKFFPGQKTDGTIKRLGITSGKKIEQNMKLLINEYNDIILNGTQEEKYEEIIYFILKSLIRVHPFDNGNGKVFWILFDLLLWQNDFFPIFVQNNNFKEKLLKVLFKYNDKEDFDLLLKDFKELIIYIYSNYKI